MVVGAPIILSDSVRTINIAVTESNNISLDDIAGKAYIYNWKNLRDKFYVGNVFYRNGKIVLMTSGSVFDGIFFNAANSSTYEYDIAFNSQHTIYEKQIVCSVSPGEFNVSTNPTAITTPIGILDINQNGSFDFQDLDIAMQYMRYKTTVEDGVPINTDWSSSILRTDDEISLYNFYATTAGYNSNRTAEIVSESIVRWEADRTMQSIFDLNGDNRINESDMYIMWKYFSNRITRTNYQLYITPAASRKTFSSIMDHMNNLSQRNAIPTIRADFMDYERLASADRTGSYLAPLATTIGLYSGLDLVAVAKLANPIKITPEMPINFIVRMDY
jgi:hypothetical protein